MKATFSDVARYGDVTASKGSSDVDYDLEYLRMQAVELQSNLR